MSVSVIIIYKSPTRDKIKILIKYILLVGLFDEIFKMYWEWILKNKRLSCKRAFDNTERNLEEWFNNKCIEMKKNGLPPNEIIKLSLFPWWNNILKKML